VGCPAAEGTWPPTFLTASAAYAIVGALSLYLNFINLFFILPRFTGGRRGRGTGAASDRTGDA
jgi:hypothetical protein